MILSDLPVSGGGGKITFDNYGVSGTTLTLVVTPGSIYKLNSTTETTAVALKEVMVTYPVTGYIQYAKATVS